jgi:hypothetical protein
MKAELSFGSCKKLVVIIAGTLFVLVEPFECSYSMDATTNWNSIVVLGVFGLL